MILLSRVAERLYWMSRYLERAEGMARVTNAYTHLIMDLPKGTEVEWGMLINIMGAKPTFESMGYNYTEQGTLKFIIASLDNASSISACIKAARENMRTTRDVLPHEIWETINELHLYCKETASQSISRRNRYEFLNQITARCQMLNGLVMTTLCRDHCYRFIKLGHLLERADINSRVLDVALASIASRQIENPAFDSLIWASLTQALGAMGTYRRAVGPMIDATSAINYLYKEPSSPRSILFCINGIRNDLKALKQHQKALDQADKIYQSIDQFDAQEMTAKQFHSFSDASQKAVSELNNCIYQIWFSAQHR